MEIIMKIIKENIPGFIGLVWGIMIVLVVIIFGRINRFNREKDGK